VPLDLPIARALERIGRSEVPDLPHRIIAATAMVLQVPLLSKDPQLKALKTIRTLW
jgi:predicted nucleic acid-binding protein